MANLVRGQVPFKAAGRDLFLQYGTRELAEAQGALGFHRPSPHQPDIVEEVDIQAEDGAGRPVLDEDGQPVFRKQRVLVNAAERQRRMIAAFEACLFNPDPEAVVAFLRIGLRPWERAEGVKLSEAQLAEIVDSAGLTRLRLLHQQAIALGAFLTGDEADEAPGQGKGDSTGPASST